VAALHALTLDVSVFLAIRCGATLLGGLRPCPSGHRITAPSSTI
jgi:hypothetical protein